MATNEQHVTIETGARGVQPSPYLPQENMGLRRRTVLIGVDPGASGGIAWIDNGRIRCIPMPSDTVALWTWFQQWEHHHTVASNSDTEVRAFAVIELVGGYISGAEKRGKNGGAANGSRMFEFGRQYGETIMAMCAAGIRYKSVAPVTWQGSIFLRKTRGEASVDHKRRMYADAVRRYPTLNVTANTADAVLICTYLNKVGFSNV